MWHYARWTGLARTLKTAANAGSQSARELCKADICQRRSMDLVQKRQYIYIKRGLVTA